MLQVTSFTDVHDAMNWADARIERTCCAVIHLPLRVSVVDVLAQCAKRSLPALVLQLGSADQKQATEEQLRAIEERERVCRKRGIPLCHSLLQVKDTVLQFLDAHFGYVAGRLMKRPKAAAVAPGGRREEEPEHGLGWRTTPRVFASSTADFVAPSADPHPNGYKDIDVSVSQQNAVKLVAGSPHYASYGAMRVETAPVMDDEGASVPLNPLIYKISPAAEGQVENGAELGGATSSTGKVRISPSDLAWNMPVVYVDLTGGVGQAGKDDVALQEAAVRRC
jgi:hypothetical protein